MGYSAFAQWNTVNSLWNLSLDVVKPSVLEKDNWVVVLNARDQHTLDIVRCHRHHHLQAGHMGKPSLQALRVLGPLSPTSTNDHSDDHRHGCLATKHVVPFRRLIDHLLNS